MSTNRPTFRFPFALQGQPKEVQQAHIFAFQGIQDLQQGIAAIKAQLDGTTSTSTSGTASATNTTTVSETVNVVTGANVGLVNNQSGQTAYTTLQSDYGSFIILNDSSPIAVTLSVTISSPSVMPPWYCTFINVGTGTATLTPVSGTINDNVVLPGNALTVAFDGTNFWAVTILIPSVTPIPFGMDSVDADDPPLIPGPVGPIGHAGTAGISGPPGQDGMDAEDTPLIVPMVGPTGPTGLQGPQGKDGPPVVYQVDDPEDSPLVVPIVGAQGPQGAQGPPGVTVYQPSEEPEDHPWVVPIVGAQGPQGAQGPPGTTSYKHLTSSTYTMVLGDRVIGVNYAGAVTVSLYDATLFPPGGIITVKDESGNANANNITLTPVGSQKIEGNSNSVLTVNYDVRRLYSNGSNWYLC